MRFPRENHRRWFFQQEAEHIIPRIIRQFFLARGGPSVGCNGKLSRPERRGQPAIGFLMIKT